jgi:hypothetical protein
MWKLLLVLFKWFLVSYLGWSSTEQSKGYNFPSILFFSFSSAYFHSSNRSISSLTNVHFPVTCLSCSDSLSSIYRFMSLNNRDTFVLFCFVEIAYVSCYFVSKENWTHDLLIESNPFVSPLNQTNLSYHTIAMQGAKSELKPIFECFAVYT